MLTQMQKFNNESFISTQKRIDELTNQMTDMKHDINSLTHETTDMKNSQQFTEVSIQYLSDRVEKVNYGFAHNWYLILRKL